MFAANTGPGRIQLYDAIIGTPILELETPDRQSEVKHLRFDPSSGRLAAGTSGQSAHMWDLTSLRRRLRELGLDWDNTALPAATPLQPVPTIRFELPELANNRNRLVMNEVQRLLGELERNPLNVTAYVDLVRLALN